MTRTFQLAAATAAAALLSLSMPALASPSFTVSPNAQGIYHGVGYVSGVDIIYPQGNPTTANPGALNVTGSGPNAGDLAGDFIAWCLDIVIPLNLPEQYSVTDTPFTNSVIPGAVLNTLTQLANTAYDTVKTNIGNNSIAAGFQLALWEVLYEDTSNGYDVSSGDFYVVGGQNPVATAAAEAQANAFLAGLTGPVTGNYKLTYLQSEFEDGGKNQIQQSQNLVTISEVPLPAAGLLLVGALGGLGVFARRRKAAVA